MMDGLAQELSQRGSISNMVAHTNISTSISFSDLVWDISKDHKIKPNTSQKGPDGSLKVPISEDNNMDEDLNTTNNNVNRSPKQNSTPKKIKLPKEVVDLVWFGFMALQPLQFI